MKHVSTLSAWSTKSTGVLRNPSVPASPASPLATIQTLTPAQHCSSSLTRSVILPALSPSSSFLHLSLVALLAPSSCLLSYHWCAVKLCLIKTFWLYLNSFNLALQGSCNAKLLCFCLSQVPLREISNSSFNELTTALWSPHSHTSLELCYVNPLLKWTLLIKCKTATLWLFLDCVFFFLSCCSIALCIMKLKRNYLFFLQSACSCVWGFIL